jgi:hypothetical protein
MGSFSVPDSRISLPPELEALMPEPAFQTLSANYFTADQVRQAMLDATERAAKKCDEHIRFCGGDDSSESVCEFLAAAIRGGGQG